MNAYETASPFLEAQAVLAAQEGDDEAPNAVLAKLLRCELETLLLAADHLADAIRWTLYPDSDLMRSAPRRRS